ncbi:Rhodanese-related sulfurtransferase [Quadrisphaera granulorum]|uniref:Rhodanese-related sulfurtransferase n=1 Tax=Quadrisphaera granulorum TaxID=317664 RepID=A0A316A4M4_9ACTN|nr:rhodanese-like domain-containing protein [Quadrisphaera granulorum]PWJ52645.1 rhodanese-related sulfurtransferase [Quadrisphaera granulorum]SZE97467.1 Rhodanese-related sulfurtransferase [Quadrisphaera granulorum]
MTGPAHRPAPQPLVSARTAAGLVADGALLVDVREDDEWAAGHAPDAVHVPLGTITAGQRPTRVPDGVDVVVVCRSGRRSAQAADRLAAAGVVVRDLDGGMQAWQDAGLPVRTDSGAPGTVA